MHEPIHLAGFLSLEEISSLRKCIEQHAGSFQDVSSPLGMGPRYQVIDGEQLRSLNPGIIDLATAAIRPAIEREAGEAVELFGSLRRAVHVQSYSAPGDGFRWHFDAHAFAAILTLENKSGGSTEWMNPGPSRWLRLPLYTFYPWPQLFSALPRRAIVPRPGDLLILPGRGALHRGTRGPGAGRRLSIVFNFDVPGRRPSHFRDWIARRLNY
jgi:hypothetical protein